MPRWEIETPSWDSNQKNIINIPTFIEASYLFSFIKGKVKGTYVIALPDGRIQTTSYTADHLNGYIADVSFQGEPVYPAEKRPAA